MTEMKKKSFIRKTIFMLGIQCILLFVVFISYLMISYYNAAKSLEQNMYNFVQIYGKELDNKIANADMLLERLIYKNSDYDMLQSENANERYYAMRNIKNMIEEQLAFDSYVDAVVITESKYESCLDYENQTISLKDKNNLRSFTMKKAGQGHTKAEWTIAEIGSKNYVYKMYNWQEKAVSIFISVDSFMNYAAESHFNKMSILLTDKDNKIRGLFGSSLNGLKPGDSCEIDSWHNIRGAGYEVADSGLCVYTVVNASQIFGQIQANMLLMLSVLLILVIFSILLIRYLRKEILIPMGHMQKSMEQMKDGDYNLRIEENYSNQEFTLLKNTFNHLMDEIVGLKIESYEKQIDLQETELRCVRLQLKPHFFLNAMTTISSLSQQAKNQEIQRYIAALSKNIRYMFRSGLHTVTLGEEIRHVENYFEMQELKYPNCVFYFFDIPKELEDWRIPQMLIHTIIENEYKYAVSVDSVLTVLIKAGTTEYQGEEMLLLEIEDDGNGYPEEFLEEFHTGEISIEKTGERVGLKSIKRMLKLMYERERLFTIENITPHGCKNIFRIPKNTVQEVVEKR